MFSLGIRLTRTEILIQLRVRFHRNVSSIPITSTGSITYYSLKLIAVTYRLYKLDERNVASELCRMNAGLLINNR
jgi:hypothetical protein